MGQEHLPLHRSGERISLDVPLDMILHEKETAVSKTELIRGTARILQAGVRRSRTQLLHGGREVLLMCNVNLAFITAMYALVPCIVQAKKMAVEYYVCLN